MSGGPDDAERPRLHVSMGAFGALLITLSCLSPGIGVFIVGSDTLKSAGTSVVLSFAAASLLGVAMAQVYAELASAFPQTGGEYTILGRTLGPAWSVAVLALNLLGFAVAQSLSGLGAATYLGAVVPGIAPVPAAAAMVVIVTAAGVLDIRVGAWITGAFLAVEIASLGLVAALGFAHPHRSLGAALLHPVMDGAHGSLTPVPWLVAGAATAGAVYAFNGYGAVVFLGEELRDARRRIAGVVFAALGLAVVTELAPLAAVLVGAPDLHALVNSPAPMSAFVVATGGPALGRMLGVGVALAIFNAMIAVSLMAGRQLYGTARDGLWPAPVSRALVHIHPRFGSPWVATLVMGAAALGGCFIDPRILLVILGNGNVAIYAGLCLAVVVGRRSGATRAGTWRMPLYPLAPILAACGLVGVVAFDLLDPTAVKGLLATVATIVLALGYWALALRRKRDWTFTGPDPAAAS